MKKKSGRTKAAQIFLMMIVFGAFLVLYVGLKKKCDDLIKQRVDAQTRLKSQNARKNSLYAMYQKLISEDRIIPIALTELQMTFADPPISTITIDAEKIVELQTLIQEQND